MSSIARWAYTNIASVWPYLGEDLENGGTTYGVPYTIECTWTRKSEQRRDADGAEFTARDIFWTEDNRPKYRDRICKYDRTGLTADAADAQEIRVVTDWDASPFGQAEFDFPDFEVVT